jgi:hypothetical protein
MELGWVLPFSYYRLTIALARGGEEKSGTTMPMARTVREAFLKSDSLGTLPSWQT